MKITYFKMFILDFYYILCFACLVNGRISDLRKCVNEDCSAPISLATTLLSYAADDERLISFRRNTKATVFSKEAGDKPNFWEVEINGKRGYAPKGLLRENKLFVKNSEVNVIVPTGRDEDSKLNSTLKLKDEKNEESNIVTPKLPSNSKGLFSTIGGVSADSVPPNSPDINPQASSSFEVVSGTTIYPDDPVSDINPENKTPTERDVNFIDDSGGIKSPEQTLHKTTNDEIKPLEIETKTHSSMDSELSTIPANEKQSEMPSMSSTETKEETLSDTETDEKVKKTQEVRETDTLTESLTETQKTILNGAESENKIESTSEEKVSGLPSELSSDNKGDSVNDTDPGKETHDSGAPSPEVPGLLGEVFSTFSNFMSSGSGGSENEEDLNEEDDYEDEIEDEESEDLSNPVDKEMNGGDDIKNEEVSENKVSDTTETTNDKKPTVEENHTGDNLNNESSKKNVELSKELNPDDTGEKVAANDLQSEKLDSEKNEVTAEINITPTNTSQLVDSDSPSIPSEPHEDVTKPHEDVTKPHEDVTKPHKDVTNYSSTDTVQSILGLKQSELLDKESSMTSEDSAIELSPEKQIESSYVTDTNINKKSSEENITSSLVQPETSSSLDDPLVFSESQKDPARSSSPDTFTETISVIKPSVSFQPQDNDETVPFMPKDDVHNETITVPENVDISAVPDEPALENSDIIKQTVDQNKQSFFYKPTVKTYVESRDAVPSNVEQSTPPAHAADESSSSITTEHPIHKPPELPLSHVLDDSNILNVYDNVKVSISDDSSNVQDLPTSDNNNAGNEPQEEVPELVETSPEVVSVPIIPEEKEDTEVKKNLMVEDETGDSSNQVSTSWLEPIFNLFSFSDSTQKTIEETLVEQKDITTENTYSSILYNKDETCAADGPEGSCETLTQQPEATPSTWQETIYQADMTATLELLERVPLDVTIWLVITAVVVLIFSLGYYYIEAHKRDGTLVAIINKLEREVLVLKKESSILEDRLHTAQEQLEAWNTNSSENDALIVELKQELEETKAMKAELEEQCIALEREVETVTESGLEMHRLLSESLSSQDGSQVLLSTVESLREKLENQEIEISNLNQKLSQKNFEVEELEEKLTKTSEVVCSLEEKILTITREREEEALELKDKHRQLIAQLEEVMETKALDETRVSTEVSKLRLFIGELQKTLAEKDLELEELKEVVKEVRSTDSNEKMDALFDVVSVRALLKSAITERDDFKERFQEEEGARKLLEGHMKKISQEVAELKNSYETAEKEKIEALTKLQVLSNYFKEKESQLQKELGLQESMWLQKQSNDHTIYEQMRSLREENEKYKLQNESLKKEIVDQESSFKIQLANVEQKSHENWVASRQAERRLKEVQQEAAQLRNRLTMEKNTAIFSLEESKHNISESNGDPSSSPPSMLFPSTRSPPFMMYPPMPPPGDFVPPPPLMGSPYPSEGRPPPLGRISSPSLDHRFSPPPPLSYPPYDYPPYGHHSPSPPPPMPTHPHHRNVHKPQPREMPRDPKDLSSSNYSPEGEKTTRRNKR